MTQTPTIAAISESRRALASPMFADLSGDIGVSFEFFPPKTDRMNETLWSSIEMLAPLGPRFVSVTYGAGGSTRERTHATVARIASETAIPAAAHLTCVDASKAEIAEVAHAYWEAGVRHIVALRGDPPVAGAKFAPHAQGYSGAADLVAGLRALHPFEISVAAYPETHPMRIARRAISTISSASSMPGRAARSRSFFTSPTPSSASAMRRRRRVSTRKSCRGSCR